MEIIRSGALTNWFMSLGMSEKIAKKLSRLVSTDGFSLKVKFPDDEEIAVGRKSLRKGTGWYDEDFYIYYPVEGSDLESIKKIAQQVRIIKEKIGITYIFSPRKKMLPLVIRSGSCGPIYGGRDEIIVILDPNIHSLPPSLSERIPPEKEMSAEELEEIKKIICEGEGEAVKFVLGPGEWREVYSDYDDEFGKWWGKFEDELGNIVRIKTGPTNWGSSNCRVYIALLNEKGEITEEVSSQDWWGRIWSSSLCELRKKVQELRNKNK